MSLFQNCFSNTSYVSLYMKVALRVHENITWSNNFRFSISNLSTTPLPMNKSTYQLMVCIYRILKQVDENMKAAACELQNDAHEAYDDSDADCHRVGSHVDVAVSVDGKWQERGFVSSSSDWATGNDQLMILHGEIM